MIVIAMTLDAIFGEPEPVWKRVPHPAVLMGRMVSALDGALNGGAMRRGKGALALVGLIVPVWLVARLLSLDIFLGVFEVIGAAILLAQRSLMDHVRAVADGLDGSLDAGRRAVAMIVGRETAALDEAGVSRAAIESAAENFSDGIVAPTFWFVLFGLPGMAVYKAVNTADSMIGYRSERYAEFGWAAAKLDDALNWVPARLSAGLIVLAGIMRRNDEDGEDGPLARYARRFDAVLEEAPLHRSPNAGWPEAATAHTLDIALSGPRLYDGRLSDDPFVNGYGRTALGAEDIRATIALIWRAWAILAGVATVAALLLL